MSKNIWEVTKFTDLCTLLKSNITVIVGLTLASTKDSDKFMIRKFLKSKAKKFPLITFVYMQVSKEYMGKLKIIPEDKSVYPMLFYIRDGNIVSLYVENVDSYSIHDSFQTLEPYYVKEMAEFQKKMKDIKDKKNKNDDNDDNNDDDDDQDEEDEEDDKKNTKNIKNKEEEDEDEDEEKDNNKGDNNVKMKMAINNTTKPLMPQIEKKKMIEKLVFMNDKYDKMKLDIIKDVQRRKKIEEKKK